MTIILDPTENEIQAFFNLARDFTGQSVLEVGCGNGRLTWCYANQASQVIGIDPKEERIRQAQADTPAELKDRVAFLAIGLEDFYKRSSQAPAFDRVLFSWSL